MKDDNKKNIVPVLGMHCSACARTVEATISKIPGVESVSVNPMTSEATIVYNPAKPIFSEAQRRLSKMGYGITQPKDENDVFSRWQSTKEAIKKDLDSKRKKMNFLLPASGVLLAAMAWQMFSTWKIPMDVMNISAFILSLATMILVGKPFLRALWLFTRGKDANMDTLIGLGTSTAFVYSSLIFFFSAIREKLGLPPIYFFDGVVIIIAFVYLGKYLEQLTKTRTGEAVAKLVGLQAKTAILIKDGQEKEVPIEEIQAGDVVRVKAGESIPSDGKIISGSGYIDESMISGEPIPKEKTVGDEVIGGTINQNGSLVISIKTPASKSSLAKIIAAVDLAQQSKAPSQHLADKISKIFVPLVIIISIITLAAWLLVGPTYFGWDKALGLGITCFISTLTIACPCALGLAIPSAVMAGIGAASRNGILIKSAEAIENLSKVDNIILDKTGTITVGHPSVSLIKITDGRYDRSEILMIAASLETGSAHPIAKAIINEAKHSNCAIHEASDIKVFAGSGISGNVDNKAYYIGRPDREDEVPQSTATAVVIKEEGKMIAIIEVDDQIKPESQLAIQEMKKRGLKVTMLSGDRRQAAENIAQGLDIDEVVAEVSPTGKAEYIEQVKKSGNRIAMAGDGINDAVALAAADIGIAMDSGSDIAIESAQIILIRGDLRLLVKSFDISLATAKTMKRGLFWAFFYNIIAIPIAAGVFFPSLGLLLKPEIAALAMSLSSLSVIGNALHLKKRFSSKKSL